MHVVERRTACFRLNERDQVLRFGPLEGEGLPNLAKRDDRASARTHEEHDTVRASHAALTVPDDTETSFGGLVEGAPAVDHLIEGSGVVEPFVGEQILARGENVDRAIDWRAIFRAVPHS